MARGAGGFDPAGRATLLHVVLRLGCCRSTRSVPDFLAKGPTWLNDFTPHVRVKLQRFTQLCETHLRNLHARIARLNKTARKEEEKLRRTEAEKRDQMEVSLEQTKENLAESTSELASVCSLPRLGSERDPVCV